MLDNIYEYMKTYIDTFSVKPACLSVAPQKPAIHQKRAELGRVPWIRLLHRSVFSALKSRSMRCRIRILTSCAKDKSSL